MTASELRGPYDLIYDSGCFHHLPPHRRISYLALFDRVLVNGGHFALTCFAAGQMGSDLPDAAFYSLARLGGGLGSIGLIHARSGGHLGVVPVRRTTAVG